MRFVLALLFLFAVSCSTTHNYYYCCTPSSGGSCCSFLDSDDDCLPDKRGNCCDEECCGEDGCDEECCDEGCCGDDCGDEECCDDECGDDCCDESCGDDCCDEAVEQIIVFTDSDEDGLPDTRVRKVIGLQDPAVKRRLEAIRLGDVAIDVMQVVEDHDEDEGDAQARLEKALRELERAVRALQQPRERKMR